MHCGDARAHLGCVTRKTECAEMWTKQENSALLGFNYFIGSGIIYYILRGVCSRAGVEFCFLINSKCK